MISERISLKELITLTGGKINGVKFLYRPILKGIRQMLWYLYVS
jgi:hypothetical protein